jgi:hypothetical protein
MFHWYFLYRFDYCVLCNSFEGWAKPFRHLKNCGANQQLKINGVGPISIETSGIAQHPYMCMCLPHPRLYSNPSIVIMASWLDFLRPLAAMKSPDSQEVMEESLHSQDVMEHRFDDSVGHNRDGCPIIFEKVDTFQDHKTHV